MISEGNRNPANAELEARLIERTRRSIIPAHSPTIETLRQCKGTLGIGRRALTKRSMRSVRVVVLDVLVEEL
jgi:hypothetical protein